MCICCTLRMSATLLNEYGTVVRFYVIIICALVQFLLPVRRYASAGNSDRNMSVSLSLCHEPVLCQNEES